MENCVSVIVTTVDGNTMTVVFTEADLNEAVVDLNDDKLKENMLLM